MGLFVTDDNEIGCGGYILILAGLFTIGLLIAPDPTSTSDIGSEVCPLDELCNRDLPPDRVAELDAALNGTANIVSHGEGGRVAEPLSSLERARLLKEYIERSNRAREKRLSEPVRLRTGEELLAESIRKIKERSEPDASEVMAQGVGL